MPTKQVKPTLTEFREKVIMYILCQYNIYIRRRRRAFDGATDVADDKKPQKKTKSDKRGRSELARGKGGLLKVPRAAGAAVPFSNLAVKARKRGVMLVYCGLLILL